EGTYTPLPPVDVVEPAKTIGVPKQPLTFPAVTTGNAFDVIVPEAEPIQPLPSVYVYVYDVGPPTAPYRPGDEGTYTPLPPVDVVEPAKTIGVPKQPLTFPAVTTGNAFDVIVPEAEPIQPLPSVYVYVYDVGPPTAPYRPGDEGTYTPLPPVDVVEPAKTIGVPKQPLTFPAVTTGNAFDVIVPEAEPIQPLPSVYVYVYDVGPPTAPYRPGDEGTYTPLPPVDVVEPAKTIGVPKQPLTFPAVTTGNAFDVIVPEAEPIQPLPSVYVYVYDVGPPTAPYRPGDEGTYTPLPPVDVVEPAKTIGVPKQPLTFPAVTTGNAFDVIVPEAEPIQPLPSVYVYVYDVGPPTAPYRPGDEGTYTPLPPVDVVEPAKTIGVPKQPLTFPAVT